jgi:PKD repeat protein
VVVDGCESKRAKVEAVVLPLPEVKLKSSANNIFVGERALLAVENPVAGTKYSWWLNGRKIWEGTELDMNFPNPGIFSFTVKAIDNLLCEGESTPLEVRVNSQAAASYFTGTPVEGVAPHQVQFSANSPAGTTAWLWDFGDSSANSTEENPIHEYQLPGRYSVTLQRTTQGITYVESRVQYIIVKTATGLLPEINEGFSFRMYPNPARDRVYIQTDRTDISKLLIGIYDMAGKEIATQTIIGQSGEISLNGLAAGVYTLRVNGVSVRLTVE